MVSRRAKAPGSLYRERDKLVGIDNMRDVVSILFRFAPLTVKVSGISNVDGVDGRKAVSWSRGIRHHHIHILVDRLIRGADRMEKVSA